MAKVANNAALPMPSQNVTLQRRLDTRRERRDEKGGERSCWMVESAKLKLGTRNLSYPLAFACGGDAHQDA